VRVDHKAYIRFVDAHAESNCRDNNRHLVVNELLMVAVPFISFHPGVVGHRRPAIRIELSTKPLRLFAFAAVDNARLPAARLQKGNHLRQAIVTPVRSEKEVLPIETGNKLPFAWMRNKFRIILSNPSGCSGSEGNPDRI
jgi:hypothetical protein